LAASDTGVAARAASRMILDAVEERRDRIVALLQDLVSIDSRTGREGPIQDYLARIMDRMGLQVDVFEPDLDALRGHPGYEEVPGLTFAGRPNVVGTLAGDPAARSLLLNGHVDTVPPEPADGWSLPPLSATVRDGAVFGRGASDMKGGLVAMLVALQTLCEIGMRPSGTVILECVVDEEMTGYGTLACIQRGYRADAGICTETSDLQILPACIGRLWFTVEVRGKSAGIATRWLAVSAIEKSVKLLQAVDDLERIRTADLTHPLYPDPRSALACMVTMITAGTFPSATPDVAVLRGSLGIMPHEVVATVKEQFRRQISLVSDVDPWLRHHPPRVTFKDVGADGAEIPVDHPIVAALCKSFQIAVGRSPVLAGRTGGSDTRFLIKYGATPTVIFGPGVTAAMHTVDESVPVQNLVNATKTLALAIRDWCG
jgi:acetylornithine deacetylase